MSTSNISGIAIVGGFNFFAQGIRFMLQNMQSTNHANISVFQTGEQYLNSGEAFDVVLVNIMISDFSGTRFTEVIKSKFPNTKVIIMSLKDDIDLSNSIASKADGFLSSYFNEQELEFAIKTVIGGEFYASSGLVIKLLRDNSNKKKKRKPLPSVA